MQTHRLAYKETGLFSGLVEDYLAEDEKITPFFQHLPGIKGLKDQLQAKQTFAIEKRKVLVSALKRQYGTILLPKNDQQNLNQRIDELLSPQTFTVTTGHQLCLFTGPLYTVYKILHTIALAEELNSRWPDNNIIPVFWMATEDHDFEEVNHAYVHGQRIEWHERAGDAVGRLPTSNIEKSLRQLESVLPIGEQSEQIITDLRQAYAEKNMADATRSLIHKWFGHKGLLIIDGDDAELKALMKPIFIEEISHRSSNRALQKANQKLKMHYKLQVSGRDINLFYLHNGQRFRLAPVEEGIEIVGGHKRFSTNEILTEIEYYPERFSPNVVLRPLYQECILPNLAYIGGGGELAYWAQLKGVFETLHIPMPVVLLRQSFATISSRSVERWRRLGFDIHDLFQPFEATKRSFLNSKTNVSGNLQVHANRIAEQFDYIASQARTVDATLEKHALAQKQKALNSIQSIEKKMWRAEARKESKALSTLENIKQQFSPGGGLQERKENIIGLLYEHGNVFLDILQKAIKPLDPAFIVLQKK